MPSPVTPAGSTGPAPLADRLGGGPLFFPVTPYGPDGGVDPEIMRTHVRQGVGAGAGAVFVCCGTGEFHALSGDEFGRAVGAAVEAAGADVLFTWDHFFPLFGEPDGEHFECWSMLAAWAEATSRVELGALVTCNSYRNPELLADMARTVDHISGGRLVLGIGSGWFEKDYAEYGYEFGTAVGRLDDLAESLPRIERRLDKLNPAPTRRIPVLVGGGGEKKTLKLVARHADIWHGFGEPDVVRRKVAVLDEHCAALGRDPAEIERSIGVGKSPEDVGKPLLDLGVTQFTVGVGGPDYDLGQLREWVSWRDEQNR